MTFRQMRDATREEWEAIERYEAELYDPADGALALLDTLREAPLAGHPVNGYDHSLQAATRALRAGEPDDMVVACLLHDSAVGIAPANHGQVAAEMLRPYVSDEVYWVVKHHGVVQKLQMVNHPYWGDTGAAEAAVGAAPLASLLRPHRPVLHRLRRRLLRPRLRDAAPRGVRAADPRASSAARRSGRHERRLALARRGRHRRGRRAGLGDRVPPRRPRSRRPPARARPARVGDLEPGRGVPVLHPPEALVGPDRPLLVATSTPGSARRPASTSTSTSSAACASR